MADRFFTPDPLYVGEIVLTGPEAHHLATVRRFKTGDRVVLFNGDDREYPADVLSISKRQVVLSVVAVETPDRELPFALEIASAMPKGDRGDFLVEKLTELGATRFTPLETLRSVVVPKEPRLEKLRQAVVEASKQCGRNVLMQVDDVTRLPAYLARTDLPARRLMLDTGARTLFREVNSMSSNVRDGAAIVIGPEGGWDSTEMEAARQLGWAAVGLGPRILRIETAAIAAAAWIGMR